MGRTYTLREAAEISTKSYSALRGMVDRGQLATHGARRPGCTRRISHEELERAGLLQGEQVLQDRVVREVNQQINELRGELRETRKTIVEQLERLEAQLAAADDEPELRAVA
ncbi:MAG TPA: hypothetical protein VN733_07095 [Solirubrobacterales bacterium]|nr:hypothetical protein [Solirubrobacterales bacterium]